MDETKQNDTPDRTETGPVRIPGPDEGEVADILRAFGHAYQVVYSQESTWVFYLRLTAIDGYHPNFIRIFLRPKGSSGSGEWSGDARWFPANREQQ